jgi:hypothetical protein
MINKKLSVEIDSEREFDLMLKETLEEIGNLLISKNIKYGDSALNPVRIFSKSDPQEQIKVRIDDKISRLVRGNALREDEDVVMDLIGYLVILQMCKKCTIENKE